VRCGVYGNSTFKEWQKAIGTERKEPKLRGNNSKNLSVPIWEREAGVRAALFQNPGKLWDAKADGVLPHAGNWSKTGVDPIFDHNQKTS